MGVKAVRIASAEALRRDGIAGSVHAVERQDGSIGGFQFICPCGCGNESWLPFMGPGPQWTWDGDLIAPTLSPSVFNTGMPCRWHGWLRNGEWVLA